MHQRRGRQNYNQSHEVGYGTSEAPSSGNKYYKSSIKGNDKAYPQSFPYRLIRWIMSSRVAQLLVVVTVVILTVAFYQHFFGMRPSRYYTIPDAMPHIGDKSDDYALLRKEFDAKERGFPKISPHYKIQANLLSSTDSATPELVPYDIYDCPDYPPAKYPYTWKLIDLLKAWPANNTTIPSHIYQGYCVFDYKRDYHKAMRYRNAELPFVIRRDPLVQRTVDRWNYPGYMNRLLGDRTYKVERSSTNFFMYWSQPQRTASSPTKSEKRRGGIEAPADWKPPTEHLDMTFSEWVSLANVSDSSRLAPDQPHWYFKLVACGEMGPKGQCHEAATERLFDELPFFQPKQDSMYMVEPQKQEGIYCRFGMTGIVSQAHWDGTRNFIAMLGGERRYILTHPKQCENLYLHPLGHPSARQSQVDWSHPDLDEYPQFAQAMGNEVVLQPGEVMYLPTNWFHFIVSLSTNYQCNARSGVSRETMADLRKCGF